MGRIKIKRVTKTRKSKTNNKRCKTCGRYMWGELMKFDFTRQEVEEIKSKIYLSDVQERIFEYKLREYSITKMADLEKCSESTISKEIKKLKKKILKVI